MVTILLSTYNGEKYLEEQLVSLLKQINVDIRIFVRDDGSTDKTCDILNQWQCKGVLTWYSGENLGPARSYFDLMKNAPKSAYYAFCDQDDVWLPDKLNTAVKKLKTSRNPSMYFSQTQMVDEELLPIDTPIIHPKCTFEESLVTSIVTGCTIVINDTLKEYICKYKPKTVLMHDSWIYKLCTSLNGNVYFDPQSYILYRQHCNNVIGLKKDWKKDWKRRWYMSIIHKMRNRSNEAKELLNGYKQDIPIKQYKLLMLISDYTTNINSKMKLLFDSKFVGNSIKQTVFLKLAIILNRF